MFEMQGKKKKLGNKLDLNRIEITIKVNDKALVLELMVFWRTCEVLCCRSVYHKHDF